jgi:hypothetical protein
LILGGGADVLELAGAARFTGSLANSSNLAVRIAGGTLEINKPVSIASLDVSSAARLDRCCPITQAVPSRVSASVRALWPANIADAKWSSV